MQVESGPMRLLEASALFAGLAAFSTCNQVDVVARWPMLAWLIGCEMDQAESGPMWLVEASALFAGLSKRRAARCGSWRHPLSLPAWASGGRPDAAHGGIRSLFWPCCM